MGSVGLELTAANFNFAVDLFHQLAQMETCVNIFLSPVSVSIALGMVYLGARHNTAAQMKTVARFPDIVDGLLHENFAALDILLNTGSDSYTLNTANKLFTERGHEFLEDYIGQVAKFYKADVTSLDFVSDPEVSRKVINTWVSARTNDKINDIIPQGSINTLTAMVLVNAIYFKGNWKSPFDKSKTRQDRFFVSDSNVQAVYMMNQLKNFRIAHDMDSGVSVLELPYASSNLSMFVFLPHENYGLAKLESLFSLGFVANITSSMREMKTDVYLPRFNFDTKYNLHEVLPQMGMTDLFDQSEADLSGMDGKHDLSVSKAYHQAYVEVNEEGTEAAAATAVVIMLRSVRLPQPPQVFKADHPFIFMIRENTSGTILFLGKMADPGGQPWKEDQFVVKEHVYQ